MTDRPISRRTILCTAGGLAAGAALARAASGGPDEPAHQQVHRIDAGKLGAAPAELALEGDHHDGERVADAAAEDVEDEAGEYYRQSRAAQRSQVGIGLERAHGPILPES